MRSRPSFAYVVEIEGSQVTLNLKDEHRGHVSSHRDGIASVTDIGSLIGVEAGHRIIILKVKSLSFAEPREAHRAGVGSTAVHGYPLRNVAAFVVGFIERMESVLTFVADNLLAPPLGAEAYPLSTEEVRAVLQIGQVEGANVYLGDTVRGHGPIRVGLNQLLTRHVAVLGGTGHGKSCFTAAVLQQLMAFPTPRIVIFDVIRNAGPDATRRFVEFFTANIRNPNTRAAYSRAIRRFCGWAEKHRLSLAQVEPVLVAAYIEELQRQYSDLSVKQHLAAIRVLFDYLVTGGVLRVNPAASVKGPKVVIRKGKTPVLSANGGTLEKAQQMAAHVSSETTQMYNRMTDTVTLDEVERVLI